MTIAVEVNLVIALRRCGRGELAAMVCRALLSCGVSSVTQFAPAVYSVAAVFLWGAADFAGGYGSRRASNAFVLTALFCASVRLRVDVRAVAFGPSMPGLSLARRASSGRSLRVRSVGFSLALFYRALASGQMGLTAPPSAALLGAAIPTIVDIALEGAGPSRWTICLASGSRFSRHLADHQAGTVRNRITTEKTTPAGPSLRRRPWHRRSRAWALPDFISAFIRRMESPL